MALSNTIIGAFLIGMFLGLGVLLFFYLQKRKRLLQLGRQLEAERQRNRLWYNSSVTVMGILEVVETGGFKIISVNEAFQNFNNRFGRSDVTLHIPGISLYDYLVHNLALSPAEADYKIGLYQECANQKKTIRFEEQTRISSFGEIITLTTLSPLFDKKGEVQQIYYTTFNISEVHKAEQKSQEAYLLLEEAEKLAPLGIWQWNAEISAFNWSRGMKSIYATEGEETPGFDQWISMMHPDDEYLVRREIEKAFVEQKDFTIEHKIIRPDGEVRHVKTWGGLRMSQKGEIREIFGICLDRTDEEEAGNKLLSAVLKAEDQARQAISRDLHDSLGQSLTTVLLNLNTLTREEDSLSPKARSRLQLALSFLDQAMVESRNIAYALMPQVVVEFGYILALENLLEAMANASPTFYLSHNLPEGWRMPAKWEVSLFRVSQEAIQNIVKHAEANEVNIQIILDKELLQLTIEDDGKGFDTAAVENNSSGLGMNNMKTRIQSLGGLLFWDSAKDRGTLLTVQIPTSELENARLENIAG